MRDPHQESVNKTPIHQALANATVAYFSVSGIDCPQCLVWINKSLMRLKGVLLCAFDQEQGVATILYVSRQIKLSDLMAAISMAVNDGTHHYEAQFLAQEPASQAMS
jgi:hypothetical protein